MHVSVSATVVHALIVQIVCKLIVHSQSIKVIGHPWIEARAVLNDRHGHRQSSLRDCCRVCPYLSFKDSPSFNRGVGIVSESSKDARIIARLQHKRWQVTLPEIQLSKGGKSRAARTHDKALQLSSRCRETCRI